MNVNMGFFFLKEGTNAVLQRGWSGQFSNLCGNNSVARCTHKNAGLTPHITYKNQLTLNHIAFDKYKTRSYKVSRTKKKIVVPLS